MQYKHPEPLKVSSVHVNVDCNVSAIQTSWSTQGFKCTCTCTCRL